MHHDCGNTASGFQLSLPDGAIPMDIIEPYNATLQLHHHNNRFLGQPQAPNTTTTPTHETFKSCLLCYLCNKSWERRIILQNFKIPVATLLPNITLEADVIIKIWQTLPHQPVMQVEVKWNTKGH